MTDVPDRESTSSVLHRLSRHRAGLPSRFRWAVCPPLVVAALLLAPMPASAGTSAPVAAASTATAPGEVAVIDPNAPTAAEVEAQRVEAERLQAELGKQAVAVTAARARLTELSGQAGAALEAYQTALRERDAAKTAQQTQEQRLAAARALVGQKQGEIGRWASRAYREGTVISDYGSLITLLEAESSDDLGERLVMLQRVGRMRGDVVETVQDAEAVQADATRRADAAALAADLAQERATRNKTAADGLLAQQRAQVVVLDDLLADTEQAAQGADQAADKLEAARVVAEQRRLAALAAAAAGTNLVVGEVGDCAGGDVSRFTNGAIPLQSLCPLWGAPGHNLRADAAYAYQQLANAFASQFGEPPCVTDSYRTLAAQVSVYQRKPGLAAVPGTSNHGWGTALDMCGGIQTFGSPAHQWMRDNAPLYGWFHPSWAQQGGSKPEAWHWEFGG